MDIDRKSIKINYVKEITKSLRKLKLITKDKKILNKLQNDIYYYKQLLNVEEGFLEDEVNNLVIKTINLKVSIK